MCIGQGHNTVPHMRLETAALRSQFVPSTTGPLRSSGSNSTFNEIERIIRIDDNSSGLEVIKLVSCSAQLSMIQAPHKN